jgi:hypothetical protein
VEVENTAVLSSTREDAEGLVRKIALLLGELVDSVGPESWPWRIPVACLTRRPMPSISGRCLRRSIRSNFRSSPFCGPEALNSVLPLSVPHG